MNNRHFILAVAAMIACVICYSVGFHAGTKQAPVVKTFLAGSPIAVLDQADLLALDSVRVNSLHPNAHTLVKGGLVENRYGKYEFMRVGGIDFMLSRPNNAPEPTATAP
jgi:hypothetical protein